MNLQVLQKSITTNFDDIRPRADRVFTKTINRVVATGHSVQTLTFVKQLNHAFLGTGVRVSIKNNKKFGDDNQYYPALGGYCGEPKTTTTRAHIGITIFVHPTISNLTLSRESWEYFQFRFIKTIQHELVHRAQFSNGRKLGNALIFRPYANPKTEKRIYRNQLYLGDIDEV